MSRYFFTPQNPDFQIDSAHRYRMQAWRDFMPSSPRLREKMKRIPLDSMILVKLGAQIDSAAFARARHADTEESYRNFLAVFTQAAQQKEAESLRNAAAYRDATRQNTYMAFASFLSKYLRSGAGLHGAQPVRDPTF